LDILEAGFGKPSTEWDRFAWARIGVTYAGGPRQEDYISELVLRETALKSILQKCETLGIVSEAKHPSSQDGDNNRADLFKNMHFHRNVEEASKQLFIDEHYAQAILEACKAVELSVKEKSGLDEIGKNLMAQAFNEQHPLIRVLESGQYLEEVQEGFKFLFMGTMLAIRNPKAHLHIVQKDPYITLEYLGLAGFLLKRIDSFHVPKE
jgi:uncharacterized protein (TIGR02391 family)